ncbi:hypothetical protein C8R48DRAFT_772684 [Suillus tomentosus]|nr:hypothetical protein C8R48DRAFT_772684 [Suillus tomentosus]
MRAPFPRFAMYMRVCVPALERPIAPAIQKHPSTVHQAPYDEDQEDKEDNDDKDDGEGDKDDKEDKADKEDKEGDKDNKEDKEGDKEDVVQSPPSKSKPARKQGRASPVQFESHPRPPVKNSMPVPSPPSKSKSTKKHGRKSKLTGGGNGRSEDNTSTGSAQSTGTHLGNPVPSHNVSKSHTYGPTSGVQAKTQNKRAPVPKPTPPFPAKATGRKTKDHDTQITNPEPKRSGRTAKASYKAHYMQK